MIRLSSRAMREQDLASVMQIEVAAYPLPWSAGIFQDCVKAGYLCTLYEFEEELVGYSVMSMGADEANLLNLCIHPAHQGKAWGVKH